MCSMNTRVCDPAVVTIKHKCVINQAMSAAFSSSGRSLIALLRFPCSHRCLKETQCSVKQQEESKTILKKRKYLKLLHKAKSLVIDITKCLAFTQYVPTFILNQDSLYVPLYKYKCSNTCRLLHYIWLNLGKIETLLPGFAKQIDNCG